MLIAFVVFVVGAQVGAFFAGRWMLEHLAY